MHEQLSTNNEPVHTDVSYEQTDAVLKQPLAAGIGVVVLILSACAISLWLFGLFRAGADRRDPGLSPLVAMERPKLPREIDKIPEPRLEVSEGVLVKKQREEEDRLLTGPPGWVDPQKGTVHIPIAEAMRLLTDPEVAKARGIRVRVEAPKGDKQ
jgi:hypothetical protein